MAPVQGLRWGETSARRPPAAAVESVKAEVTNVAVPGPAGRDSRPGAAGIPLSWRLHRERVLLLGWGSAILLQCAHPLVAQGVTEHSRALTRPAERWHRLWRTLNAMFAMTFGSDADAQRAAHGIMRIHDRVHGRLGEAAGGFPAHTPYSAHDPGLLRWVHATLVDSHLRAYGLYVGPLADWERDRYCEEASRIEALLGIPGGDLPRSVAALEGYLNRMLDGNQIVVTPTARALAGELLSPPLPVVAWPLVRLLRLATVGLLPAPIRVAYGLAWGRRHEILLQRSARLIRHALPLVPPIARYWPAARAAARRHAVTEP